MVADWLLAEQEAAAPHHPVTAQPLPLALRQRAHRYLQKFQERASREEDDWLFKRLQHREFRNQWTLVWGCSAFVAETCARHPSLLRELAESSELATTALPGQIAGRLREQLAGIETESDLHQCLRRFRRQQMVRIVWRDFCRLADLLETTGDMTVLAEACIQGALDYLYPAACAQWGTPIGRESGQAQHLLVLGMGKMGAWELNVSSDIDLIFAFAENGDTRGGRRQLSNQEFFIRLGQSLIQALDKVTADGFVFRVDMRLRPYGQSGALAMSFDALEEYYQAQGRDWERYAMVKARVVCGDPRAAARLMTILRPFTYRRYIDYSAIQALRDMKALITREVQRLGALRDIKRGAGGIREIEFIAQAFQLIRGGKDSRFRDPSLQQILRLLATEALLPAKETEELWEAYCFLRNAEHALQGGRDKQTQRLPDDETEQLAIATVMGFRHWREFIGELDVHCQRVSAVFAGIAADSQNRVTAPEATEAARAAWLETGGTETQRLATLAAELTELGFETVAQAPASLEQLRSGRAVLAMTSDVRQRLDKLMPLLLTAIGRVANSEATLQRILTIVDAIARRSAYMVLLVENPGALEQLVKLCAESTWIARQLSRYPALLDELLDQRNLYSLPDKEALRDDLRQQVLLLDPEDLEVQMEALRYFRLAHSLRVAASEVVGTIALMQVSDHLTWVAEVLLEHVLAQAWQQMVQRYGEPGSRGEVPGFVIVGYGKLGGIELGHGSDLDLVFIHNADINLETTGAKVVDNGTFFMRLGQRIIHILSARTHSGNLYEVDMRLRPSGNSGLLVSTLSAFEKYQEHDAWSWEHQALVRARPVAGDQTLADAFQKIRARILQFPRDQKQLAADVVKMRQKMRDHLGSKSADLAAGRFNLKQDPGGIVDIEFMVQFAVLAKACDYPALTRWSDNMRLLDALEEYGVFSPNEAESLREAYKNYRIANHRLQLLEQKPVAAAADFGVWRDAVSAVWRRLLLEL